MKPREAPYKLEVFWRTEIHEKLISCHLAHCRRTNCALISTESKGLCVVLGRLTSDFVGVGTESPRAVPRSCTGLKPACYTQRVILPTTGRHCADGIDSRRGRATAVRCVSMSAITRLLASLRTVSDFGGFSLSSSPSSRGRKTVGARGRACLAWIERDAVQI